MDDNSKKIEAIQTPKTSRISGRDYGFETWNEDVLANVRQGILLRLVQRDGSQTTVQFDLNALKQDSIAYPLIVRR